jgi:hypothetical protein
VTAGVEMKRVSIAASMLAAAVLSLAWLAPIDIDAQQGTGAAAAAAGV